MAPRVSVVMPVYNGERYLAEAIQSVCDSSFRDFELLVLDDGSTDRSRAIAEGLAEKDARIRCIPLQHGGVVAARNAGLREASGEYIANLDADDATLPDRFERQVRYLDSHPECVAVGSRVVMIDEVGSPKGILIRTFTHDDIDQWHMSGLGGGVGNPTAMFRREIALKVGGYTQSTESLGEDYDLWLRLAEVGKLANLRDVLVRYRVHSSNLSVRTGDRDRAIRIVLDILGRAFERRGIKDRKPRRIDPPPLTPSERLCDEALLLYFRGNRRRALLRALRASVHSPAAPSTWHTLKTVLSGPAPA